MIIVGWAIVAVVLRGTARKIGGPASADSGAGTSAAQSEESAPRRNKLPAGLAVAGALAVVVSAGTA